MGNVLQWVTALGVAAILGGFVTHVLTTLAKEAEREYAFTLEGYSKLLGLMRNILEDNPAHGRQGIEAWAKEIDQGWLYASDDVLQVVNAITDRTKGEGTAEGDRMLFGRLVEAMRADLWRKRGLLYKFSPRRKTRLRAAEYRLLGPRAAAGGA